MDPQVAFNAKGSGTVTSVTGGSGLTGGTITSTGTLAVKAGTGIIVNANGVSVDSTVGSVKSVTSGDGLTGGPITSTGTLAVKAGTGIVVNANGVSVKAGSNIVVNANGVSVSANVVTINQFSQSLSSSGYSVLPNGLLLQWGTIPGTSSETTSTVTFPISFSAVYSITGTSINSSSDNENDYWMQVVSLYNTGCVFYHNSSDGGGEFSPGYYIAIGKI